MGFKWHGPQVQAAIEAGVVAGLNEGANHLLNETVPRTPLLSGALRRSLQVATAERGYPVAAVYSDSPYAAKQHEDMGARHSVGQAKYLESAANDERRRIAEIITQRIREASS